MRRRIGPSWSSVVFVVRIWPALASATSRAAVWIVVPNRPSWVRMMGPCSMPTRIRMDALQLPVGVTVLDALLELRRGVGGVVGLVERAEHLVADAILDHALAPLDDRASSGRGTAPGGGGRRRRPSRRRGRCCPRRPRTGWSWSPSTARPSRPVLAALVHVRHGFISSSRSPGDHTPPGPEGTSRATPRHPRAGRLAPRPDPTGTQGTIAWAGPETRATRTPDATPRTPRRTFGSTRRAPRRGRGRSRRPSAQAPRS